MSKIIANNEIAGYSVIIIDEFGKTSESIKFAAINAAKERGLDLVQVSKNDKGISVCKFADAGKMKYEASKKKVTQKPIETKEMMFHLNTASNDIDTKKRKVRHMLEKKCMVKFGIELKGRERAFMNTAKDLLKTNVVDFRDIAKWDDLKVADNIIYVILKPSRESINVDQNKS